MGLSREEGLELIGVLEEKIGHHLESAMLLNWGKKRAKAGYLTVQEYFGLKIKLGMGY